VTVAGATAAVAAPARSIGAPTVELRPERVRTRFAEFAMTPADSEPAGAGCVVCGARDPLVFTSVGAAGAPALERALCESCGHIAFSRRPSAPWFERFYRSSFETGAAEPAAPPPIDYSAISDLLTPLVPDRSAKILDVGCGYGSALAHFAGLGYDNLAGVELSDRRVRVARRLGVPIFQSTAEEMDAVGELAAAGPFDAAFTWHVFEHVVDPVRSLRNIAALLKPNGVLFVCIPNAEAEHLLQMAHYAPHIHSWSPHSLATALHLAGLDVIHADDSLRMLARKRDGGPPAAPSEPFAERLRRKFIRDFGLRTARPDGRVLVRWSDYRGSREILEASYGEVAPVTRAAQLRDAAIAAASRSDRLVARLGLRPTEMVADARVALDAPAPLLRVVYGPGPARAWVK
jgi:2-polyprenyl-3-methyl-5-hydroxy-6-metoxy-1,4-benzoquinol methylase